MRVSRSFTGWVNPEDAFYKRTVDEIACNKDCKATDKGYHGGKFYQGELSCYQKGFTNTGSFAVS